MLLIDGCVWPLFIFTFVALSTHVSLPYIMAPLERAVGAPSCFGQLKSGNRFILVTSTARSLSLFLTGLGPVLRFFGSWIYNRELDATLAHPVIAIWASIMLAHELTSYALASPETLVLYRPTVFGIFIAFCILNRTAFVGYVAIVAAAHVFRSQDYFVFALVHLFPIPPRESNAHWSRFLKSTQRAEWFFAQVDKVEMAALVLLLVQIIWQFQLDFFIMAIASYMGLVYLPDEDRVEIVWARKPPALTRNEQGLLTNAWVGQLEDVAEKDMYGVD